MKKNKRILLFSVLIAVLSMLFAASVSAAGEITDGYYKYRVLDNGTVEITDYIGTEDEIIIPEEFDGKKVTKIGEESFYGVDATKVVLPSGTELIDWFAFSYCENLETVAFNEGLKTIDTMAFANCRALEEINLPESIEKISWGAFDDAAETIEELVIPGNVKSCDINEILESNEPNTAYSVHKLLRKVAFNEGVEIIKISNTACTGLKYVYVPASVKKLDTGVLYTDRAFEAIIYAGSSEQWAEVELGENIKKLIDKKEISVHIESEHTTEKKKYVMPSCGSYGYTSGEYCETCDAWISGHEIIVSYDKHDYQLSDSDPAESIEAATFEEHGYKLEECIFCGDRKTTIIPKVTSVTLSTTNYVYNGKNRTPKVTVKDSEGNVLVKNRDYKLTVPSKRSGIGKHRILVELTGDYYGYKYVYFYIRPATPGARVASTAKGRATVAWTDIDGETGYQVWYSTSKNGGYKKISNYKADTVKIYKTGLQSGKTYYFRVRAYTKTNSGYVYSNFSTAKALTIR